MLKRRILAFGLFAAVTPTTSYGFGPIFADTIFETLKSPNGNCVVEIVFRAVDFSTFISLNGSSFFGFERAGGSRWIWEFVDVGPPSITLRLLAACGWDGATNLVQRGADGDSFLMDDYIGFRFDQGGFRYEYALVGATDTQLVETPTPLLNFAPTANAGPEQTVASRVAVALDATGPCDTGSGPAVSLSDATAASPGFTTPTLLAGEADLVLTFSLMVINIGYFQRRRMILRTQTG